MEEFKVGDIIRWTNGSHYAVRVLSIDKSKVVSHLDKMVVMKIKDGTKSNLIDGIDSPTAVFVHIYITAIKSGTIINESAIQRKLELWQKMK